MKEKVNLTTENGLKMFLNSIFANKQITFNNFVLQGHRIVHVLDDIGSPDITWISFNNDKVLSIRVFSDGRSNYEPLDVGEMTLLQYILTLFNIKAISDCVITVGSSPHYAGQTSSFTENMIVNTTTDGEKYIMPCPDVMNHFISQGSIITEIRQGDGVGIPTYYHLNKSDDGSSSARLEFSQNNIIKFTGTVEFIPK